MARLLRSYGRVLTQQRFFGIQLVQTKSQNAGSYSNTNVATLTSNVTAGNLLVLGLTAGSADTVSSITDNQSNTWTLAASNTGTDRQTWIYYAKNVNGGSTTVTVTFAASTFPDSCLTIREYSGLDRTSPLDKTASANDGTSFLTTHDTGTTAATTQANELAVAVVGSSGSSDPVFAAGTNYGHLQQQNGFDVFTYQGMTDRILTATGTQNTNMTTTGSVRGEGVLVTFKTLSVSGTNYTQVLTDTITYTDTLVRTTVKALLETITYSDTLTKAVTKVLTDTITWSDSLLKTTLKSLTETITYTDSFFKQAVKVLTETITYTDSFIKTTTKVLIDTITWSDTLLKKALKTFTETITYSDTLLKQIGKVLTETITWSDVLTAIKSGGTLFTQTLTETITYSDTLVKSTIKVLSDSLTWTDSLTKSISRTLTDTITWSDTLLKKATKVLSETVTLSDVLTQARIFARVLSETITLTDTFTRVANYYRTFTETITWTDVLSRAINGALILFDLLSRYLTGVGLSSRNSGNSSLGNRNSGNTSLSSRNSSNSTLNNKNSNDSNLPPRHLS